MNKLPFLLPDFTRIIWHGAGAKEVWAPRISRINKVWGEIEREAVRTGMRDGCLTFVEPQHLPDVALWAAARKLVVLPVAIQGVAPTYSSTSLQYSAGKPFHYRIVLTRPELVPKWALVWEQQGKKDCAIGELLGYPLCCQAFFEDVWVKDQGVDTTWQMAKGTKPRAFCGEENRYTIFGDTSPEANILLRWLGVRLVPHLPCSFDCVQTRLNGLEYARLGRVIDAEAVDWIYEMLSWPIEWSALHGIAEVRTPILTISTRTDATSQRHVVQKEGTAYPTEGASGLRFPFRVVKGKVTDKPSFKRSVAPVHELNGFGSAHSMETAHKTLLSMLPKEPGFLVDLGCGTGRFLEQAAMLGWTSVGIEHDNTRAGAAKVPVKRGNLFDVNLWGIDADVIAFMPGRLLEVEQSQAEMVRVALKQRAKHVLLYAYGDWLTKYGSLGPLAAAAGLGDCEVLKAAKADGVEAALVVFNRKEALHEREEEEAVRT